MWKKWQTGSSRQDSANVSKKYMGGGESRGRRGYEERQNRVRREQELCPTSAQRAQIFGWRRRGTKTHGRKWQQRGKLECSDATMSAHVANTHRIPQTVGKKPWYNTHEFPSQQKVKWHAWAPESIIRVYKTDFRS